MTVDLDKLEALAKAATPGPYTFGTKYVAKPQHGTYHYVLKCPDGTEDTRKWEADAKYFAKLDPETVLKLIALARSAPPAGAGGHEFKNFHRLLCERFGYVHDEQDWQRDQLSLIEHIAARIAKPKPEMPPEMKAAIEEAHKTGATAALLPNGSAVFINYGHDFGDNAHLECTACGGSGHIEDQQARAAHQASAQAGSVLACKTCGADRSKERCKAEHWQRCPMMGTAHDTPSPAHSSGDIAAKAGGENGEA